jgi:hypothetical protein
MFKWTNAMDTNLHSKLNDTQILKHIQTLQKRTQIVREKYHNFHQSLNSLMI